MWPVYAPMYDAGRGWHIVHGFVILFLFTTSFLYNIMKVKKNEAEKKL